MSQHEQFMQRALLLAEQGRYSVSPNPMVGCVIVNQSQIVGEGWHHKAGAAHAEINALTQAGEKARDATAYVTLEPCCHYGRTPPCTTALIQAGIRDIYIACQDPNPLVAGRGVQQLQQAGIQIHIGLLESQAVSLNRIFFHYIQHKTPYVILKWAMSLDGKTITHPADSRQITCQASQSQVHVTRAAVDAILVGANTALIDNPQLTVRCSDIKQAKNPLRIILTKNGHLPLNLRMLKDLSSAKTLIATTAKAAPDWVKACRQQGVEVIICPTNLQENVDINYLLTILGDRGISSLLVEGGEKVHQSFLETNNYQHIDVYIAPLVIGTLPVKQFITINQYYNIGKDIFIFATP